MIPSMAPAVKRVIQRTLQNALAQEILSGKILDGQTVEVSANRDGLSLGVKAAKQHKVVVLPISIQASNKHYAFIARC